MSGSGGAETAAVATSAAALSAAEVAPAPAREYGAGSGGRPHTSVAEGLIHQSFKA